MTPEGPKPESERPEPEGPGPEPEPPVTPEGDDKPTPRAAVTPEGHDRVAHPIVVIADGDGGEAPPSGEAPSAGEASSSGEAPATGEAPRPAPRHPRRAPHPRSPPRPIVVQTAGGTGLRLMAAALLVPWLLGYGITGSWAVARGVRGVTQHVSHLDAGYSRAVSPASLVLVGGLLLAGFAVLLAASLLLVASSQRRGLWSAVLVLALLLVAGAVWAGVAGHVNPGLWVVLFFGLLLAAVAAAVALVRMPGGAGRARIAEP